MMVVLPLAQRKTQVELLAAACAARRQARVTWWTPDQTGPTIASRLLALEAERLLLDWPPGGLPDVLWRGSRVDVVFEHADAYFTFTTESRGRTWHPHARRGRVPAWELSLPVRIQRRQPRVRWRAALPLRDPIAAQFTRVADARDSFVAFLLNVSTGGLGAAAPAPAAGILGRGELFWAEFALSKDAARLEFVVRVAHARVYAERSVVHLGCRFCPGEDPGLFADHVRAIERFVAAGRGALEGRGNAPAMGGS